MATIPASENVFPEVLLEEVAAPAAAATGQVRLYVKSDGLPYVKDDAGTETGLAQAGTDLAAHLADTADAHDASAISIVDAGTLYTATDVEAALAEVMTAVGGGGIPSTIVDAKGDIIAATAADTVARLAVGTNGYPLVAASGETTGLKYAPAASFHGARGLKSASQTISTATWTAITLTDADTYDTDAYHDPGGANPERFTVPTGLGGYYVVHARIAWDGSTAGDRYLAVYKNGTQYGFTHRIYDPTAAGATQEHFDVLSLVATDYVTLHVHQDSGGNLNCSGGYMSISLIGV